MADHEAATLSLRVSDGAQKLACFLRDHGITLREAGKAVGVEHPTVLDWTVGRKRPRVHHREAIERWTSGDVKADDWMFPEEREVAAKVVPFESAAPEEN